MAEIKQDNEVWVSNTHTGTPLISTCIDYFTFRFNRGYQDCPHLFNNLFKILLVDPTKADIKPGLNGYETRLLLAPGITLYFGGAWTRTCLGENTTVLELKGSGCREFEDRRIYKLLDQDCSDRFAIITEIWIQLFEECMSLGGVCTRIDIPVDDFSNDITIDELKHKVEVREYTTRMKKIEESSSYIDSDKDQYCSENNRGLADLVSKIDSKNKGCSITFGNRTSVQLCIYDKAAEQHNKDQSLGVDHWIRFESRFYHKNADYHFLNLYDALCDGDGGTYIVGVLRRIFEFKESNNSDSKHLYRVPTWSKWLKLTETGRDVNLFSLPVVIKDIDVTAAWIMNSVSKAFSKVVFSLPEEVDESEVYGALLIRGLSKFGSNDLAEVNSYRRKINLKEFTTIDELKKYYYAHADLPEYFHPQVVELLLNKKTRGRKISGSKAPQLEKEFKK